MEIISDGDLIEDLWFIHVFRFIIILVQCLSAYVLYWGREFLHCLLKVSHESRPLASLDFIGYQEQYITRYDLVQLVGELLNPAIINKKFRSYEQLYLPVSLQKKHLLTTLMMEKVPAILPALDRLWLPAMDQLKKVRFKDDIC